MQQGVHLVGVTSGYVKVKLCTTRRTQEEGGGKGQMRNGVQANKCMQLGILFRHDTRTKPGRSLRDQPQKGAGGKQC